MVVTNLVSGSVGMRLGLTDVWILLRKSLQTKTLIFSSATVQGKRASK